MSPYLEGVGGASGELRGFTEKDTEPPPQIQIFRDPMRCNSALY